MMSYSMPCAALDCFSYIAIYLVLYLIQFFNWSLVVVMMMVSILLPIMLLCYLHSIILVQLGSNSVDYLKTSNPICLSMWLFLLSILSYEYGGAIIPFIIQCCYFQLRLGSVFEHPLHVCIISKLWLFNDSIVSAV